MTNNLNGTPLLSKIISLRQHLCTVGFTNCFISNIQCPRFGNSHCVLYRIYRICDPGTSRSQTMSCLKRVCLRNIIVYLPSPCQHRTWYQIWHGTAKKQQAIVQIGCEWSFLVRPKYTYTKAKRTNSRQDEQAHTLLNSVPVFHIFDFSNREEDLKDKIRLLLASSQNKLKIFSQWPMFIIVEQLQVGKNDEYFRLARVLKRNNMRSDWSTSPGLKKVLPSEG